MTAPPRPSEAQVVQEQHLGDVVPYEGSSAGDEDTDSDEEDQDDDSDELENMGEGGQGSQRWHMNVSDSPDDLAVDEDETDSVSNWGNIENVEEERPLAPALPSALPLGLSTRMTSSAHAEYE